MDPSSPRMGKSQEKNGHEDPLQKKSKPAEMSTKKIYPARIVKEELPDAPVRYRTPSRFDLDSWETPGDDRCRTASQSDPSCSDLDSLETPGDDFSLKTLQGVVVEASTQVSIFFVFFKDPGNWPSSNPHVFDKIEF